MYAIRSWLLVGKYIETRDRELLAASGVGAMLQLAEAVPQDGVASLYLAVDDGAPIPPALLTAGLAFVREARESGRAVLVACGAGTSRSVAFAAAALAEAEGLSVLNAVHAVRARHPDARPHFQLLRSLCEYFGEAATTAELVHAWTGGSPG